MEAGRGVDDLAGHEHLAARVAAHGSLTGLDPDPDLQRFGEARLLPKPVGARADRKCGAHGANGIVLVYMGQSENRHHRVADELLGAPPEREELLGCGPEELAEHLASPLGIEPSAEPGRVHDVGKEDGDHLPFLGADEGSHGGAAVGAEPGSAGEGAPADRTHRNHPCRICCNRMTSKTEALSRVPLFAQLTKRELEFVCTRADEVEVPAGRKLTTQGRPGDSFYVLLEGEAYVDVDGKARRTLKPGDFFGEISMLDRGLASATVTSKTPARLLVMSHAQFRDAIKGSDGLLVKVLAAMGERLRSDMEARAKKR